MAFAARRGSELKRALQKLRLLIRVELLPVDRWHLPGDKVSVNYSIRVEKDGANVTARYDLRIPMDTTELLASFALNVEGKNLIDTFQPQKAFAGTKFYLLTNPSANAPVSFAITTNEMWTADGSDQLQGQKKYDDVSFSN